MLHQQSIWLLTQAQMDMGTVAQQQQNRKVDIRFIQNSLASCAKMTVSAQDHVLNLHVDFNTKKLEALPRSVSYKSLWSPRC